MVIDIADNRIHSHKLSTFAITLYPQITHIVTFKMLLRLFVVVSVF
jgi:hypothetical protein